MSCPLRIHWAALLLLAAGSCERPLGAPRELARFGFEERGWGTQGPPTEEHAFEGRRSCQIDGGLNGASAYSRLIPVEGVEVLDLTWWIRIEELRSPRVNLLLRGFYDAPSPHPAVPDVPQSRTTHSFAQYDSDVEEWKHGTSRVVLADTMPAASHVALEVRIVPPKIQGQRVPAGRIYLDDLIVQGRSR